MIILDATTKIYPYLIHRFQEQRALLLKEIQLSFGFYLTSKIK